MLLLLLHSSFRYIFLSCRLNQATQVFAKMRIIVSLRQVVHCHYKRLICKTLMVLNSAQQGLNRGLSAPESRIRSVGAQQALKSPATFFELFLEEIYDMIFDEKYKPYSFNFISLRVLFQATQSLLHAFRSFLRFF